VMWQPDEQAPLVSDSCAGQAPGGATAGWRAAHGPKGVMGRF
jgi:hypothetical protein